MSISVATISASAVPYLCFRRGQIIFYFFIFFGTINAKVFFNGGGCVANLNSNPPPKLQINIKMNQSAGLCE